MFLPDTPQDHDNRMYEVGLSDGKDEAAKRIAELEAALGKAINTDEWTERAYEALRLEAAE